MTEAAPVACRGDAKHVAWRRWAVLAAYTAAIYATLPVGPRAGRALLRTGLGGWLLGGGAAVVAVAGGVTLLIVLVRRDAPRRAYVALAAAAVGSWGGLAWLRAQNLERIHLPEYAVTAWLAWWALAPTVAGETLGYAAAAGLAAAIGWGEELLQAVVPGRVYDPRDVAANALGALLGVLVVVAVRSSQRHKIGRIGGQAPK